MTKLLKIVFILFFSSYILYSENGFDFPDGKYRGTVARIIERATKDSLAWKRLAFFCDTFGPRTSGSSNLEKSLKWIEAEMINDGFENILAEEVSVTHWERGNEYLKIIEPRVGDIPMLGLGRSIATPPEGIIAPVLVVRSFEELERRADEAKGKIVVFAHPFRNYGHAVRYRWYGAIAAAKAGAVACLSRSASPQSFRHPHTGSMGYEDTVKKIPAAAICEEDAEMLYRMQENGQELVLKLYMESRTFPDAVSHNLMGEYKGRELPDEIIAAGGHIDSWDAGTGAHDDASGCFAVWEAVKLLKELGLRPRRTIRPVMWTNEEIGVMGGKVYAENHKNEKHVLMFEFDSGIFPPSEFGFQGPDSLEKIVKAFEPLLKMVDSVNVVDRAWGVDVMDMVNLGVPLMNFNTDDKGTYFRYHHSALDTPDKVDPYDYNKCIAAIAIALYLYADLPLDLPNQLDHRWDNSTK